MEGYAGWLLPGPGMKSSRLTLAAKYMTFQFNDLYGALAIAILSMSRLVQIVLEHRTTDFDILAEDRVAVKDATANIEMVCFDRNLFPAVSASSFAWVVPNRQR